MVMPMGDILIRDVPDALRADLKELARKKGKPVGIVAREALRIGVTSFARTASDSDQIPLGQRLHRLFQSKAEPQADFAEFEQILAEIRHGPDRDLPDLE